jgi:hypothetical protein
MTWHALPHLLPPAVSFLVAISLAS